MQRANLATGDKIFVILSKKYLESPYCMYELFKIWDQSRRSEPEFLDRIRVFRLPDARIGEVEERLDVSIYWKSKYGTIEEKVKKHGPSIIGGEDLIKYKMMKDFALHVDDILSLVSDILQPRTLEELEQFSFDTE